MKNVNENFMGNLRFMRRVKLIAKEQKVKKVARERK